jgi:hypothetical protein
MRMRDLPEKRSMQEQLEDQGGRDLVGNVGNTHVEEGQLGFDDVTDEHLQLGLVVGALHSLLQLGHHSLHNQIGTELKKKNSITKCVCLLVLTSFADPVPYAFWASWIRIRIN